MLKAPQDPETNHPARRSKGLKQELDRGLKRFGEASKLGNHSSQNMQELSLDNASTARDFSAACCLPTTLNQRVEDIKTRVLRSLNTTLHDRSSQVPEHHPKAKHPIQTKDHNQEPRMLNTTCILPNRTCPPLSGLFLLPLNSYSSKNALFTGSTLRRDLLKPESIHPKPEAPQTLKPPAHKSLKLKL